MKVLKMKAKPVSLKKKSSVGTGSQPEPVFRGLSPKDGNMDKISRPSSSPLAVRSRRSNTRASMVARPKHRVRIVMVNDTDCPVIGLDVEEEVQGKQYLLKTRLRRRESLISTGFTPILPSLDEYPATDAQTEKLCPSSLTCDDDFGSGSEVFGFRTPKKSNAKMKEKADSARKYAGMVSTPGSPRTPSWSGTTGKKELHSTPRTRRLSGLDVTPRLRRKSLEPRTPESSHSYILETPLTVRKKIQRGIASLLDDDSEESVDDSDADKSYIYSGSSSSDDEEEVDENYNITPIKRVGLGWGMSTPVRTRFITPLKSSRKKLKEKECDEIVEHKAEDFFDFCRKRVTSNNTLACLENPQFSPEQLKKILSGVDPSHEQEREELFSTHVSHYSSQWMTVLREGYSVFLYGVGSKKHLLSSFQEMYLAEYDHLVINGFFPSLTLKCIMNSFFQEILGFTNYPQGIMEQVSLLKKMFGASSKRCLFLLVHNLDGPMLRADKTQSILSQVAALPNIHLIASLDHINAPLIFDGTILSAYNALWYEVTTFASYCDEIAFENSLMVNQTGALALSSLTHVFKSLTPNAKGIFLLLAKYQLQFEDDSQYSGMSFGDLYQRCREQFLVNSDLTLRAQLTEFKDHKLIRLKKGLDGIENLVILLESATLKEFVEQQNEVA